MFVPSFFEVYGASYIFLFFSFQNCSLVYHILLVAVVFDWTVFLVSSLAVAAAPLFFSVVAVGDFAVMAFDYLFHVFAAAVRHFDGASVENWA